MLGGLCETPPEEVETGRCSKGGLERVERPSVVREEHPPDLQVRDCSFDWRSVRAHLPVPFFLPFKELAGFRFPDRGRDVVRPDEALVAKHARRFLQDLFRCRSLQLSHVVLIAGNRVGNEDHSPVEICDDQRSVAGCLVLAGPELLLPVPGPARPERAVYQCDRSPGRSLRCRPGWPVALRRPFDQWRQDCDAPRYCGLSYAEDVGPYFVSIRKSCERPCRWPAWRSLTATPVMVLLIRSFTAGWRLGPGPEIFRARVPGQEAFQRRPREGLAAVAAAFVEVGGQVGEDIQPGHLHGGGDGPGRGGVLRGALVVGAAGVLAGDDRPADRPQERRRLPQRAHREERRHGLD